MKLLMGYATSDGQTRRIARHVADRLADAGHGVELLALPDAADLDLARFDRVILAASLHLGHYQPDLADFVSARRDMLKSMPTLMLSVSLAAAGHDADEWKSLDEIAEDWSTATGWTPDILEQVAGAYRPSQYDIVRRFLMRRIIADKDPQADPRKDVEYTDWAALDATVDDWLIAEKPA